MRWPRAQQRTERLTILSQRDGRAHVLQPVGELAVETVGRFEDELKRVEATDVPEIRVDLSRVDFIDSDGLKLFIKASARCSERSGAPRVPDHRPRVAAAVRRPPALVDDGEPDAALTGVRLGG